MVVSSAEDFCFSSAPDFPGLKLSWYDYGPRLELLPEYGSAPRKEREERGAGGCPRRASEVTSETSGLWKCQVQSLVCDAILLPRNPPSDSMIQSLARDLADV